MTTEERVLRIENAFATLSELVAQSHELAAQAQRLAAQSQELASRVSERTTNLERSMEILTELARNASERADTHDAWINQLGTGQAELRAAQAESEHKIAALVDSQLLTEETVRALAGRVDSLTSVVERLVNERREGQS
jgi:DNA repair exonuclease SbcCD ATPase subunit